MDVSVLALALTLVLAFRVWNLPGRLAALQEELAGRKAEQNRLQAELQRLRDQLAELLAASKPAASAAIVATPAPPMAAPVWRPAATTVAAPAPLVPAPPTPEPTPEPVLPAEPVVVAPAVVEVEAVAEAEPISEPVLAVEVAPAVEPTLDVELATEPELVPQLAVAPVATLAIEPELTVEAEPATELEVVAELTPATELAPEPAPAAEPEETQTEPAPNPAPVFEPELIAEPAPTWVPAPRQALPPTPPPRKPAPPRRPAPKPVPTGPTWWERASTMLLENWTGILGAIVLVTGVGFLGIYTALRVAPPLRFLMICAFAGGLLGARYALRAKPFAKKLNAWLVSSAAAIFLFACVGAVSIAGLRWATPPFDYLLLLAGVSANLYLAWRTSREEVATLHGVLSLVALAVLPPTALTLGAAAGVTAFSIAITYRQLWKYQLLLSIASFFAFHLYWHQELAVISNPLRLAAMALVLLVGGAAAVVQYRSVYAQRRFEPLLFTAHLLNWTCLGVNLYLYSTGSVWKTIPLALGALLTFWAGRRAKQLGIGWLFQTDTIISLILALATALSLQGWHATPTVIGLFMLLESLLITLVMARQREALVYRVALTTAVLAGTGILTLAGTHWVSSPPAQLYREVLVLALAGSAGLAFVQLILKQPLLKIIGSKHVNGDETDNPVTADYQSHRSLLNVFAGLTGLLQLGAGLGLARILFGWSSAPVGGLLLGMAGAALALAVWVRRAGRAPSWVRWQQLVLAQFFVLLALLSLHEAGLNWSIVLLLLYAENLLLVLLLAGRAEHDRLHQHVYRAALAVAAVAGLSVLLRASHYLPGHSAATLYREALVLTLAGWLTLAFVQAACKWPLLAAIKPYLPRLDGEPADSSSQRLVSNHEAHFNLLNGFAGLGGGLQVVGGAVLGRLLFGVPGVPVVALLGALVALAGSSIGLAWWVRTVGNAPGWVRWQQLVLAQVFALLALLGLHKLGLNWSATLLLVYFETLLVALLLAGRAAHDLLHRQLYRGALAVAALVGLLVLLRASSYLPNSLPAVLYREALIVALAGWASLLFVQAAFKWQFLAGIKPYLPSFADASLAYGGLVSNAEEQRGLVSAFAGLGGLLQALAGVALSCVAFGWSHEQSVARPLGLLLGLAGISLGLAAWVRTAGQAPGWVRWQQLVLAQFFVLLALLGLHKVGLPWSTVLFIVFSENLLVAVLLAGRAEHDLLHQRIYRVALASALLTGTSLLLLVATHVAGSGLAILYRETVLLALAGWFTLAFAQATLKWPLLTSIKPYLPRFNSAESTTSNQLVSNPTAHYDLLGGFAGLAGLLQAEAGLVLGRLVFGWVNVPVAGLLLAIVGLAGAALGLAIWVRTSDRLPNWVRRQQLILAQGLAVLAVVGLHELGLSWPGILCVLYAENLLVALLLSGRDEEGLLHTQTYLLVLQAAVLPLLVRYTSLGALSPQMRALLLVGAALLTLGYQARRRYWRRAQDEFASLSLGMSSSLPVLGLAVGWLLLGAGSLVYAQPWAAWPAMALLGALLYLRQRLALPGLWAGLMVAATTYVALQWGHVLHPLVSAQPDFRAGYVLLYLLPTLAVPMAGLFTSWWPDGERYVRWPWLYLLGAHLVVGLVAAVPAGHVAYLLLGLLALGSAAFGAALAWRRTLPDEAAVLRAGQPDRYLLHLGYGGLAASLLLHIYLILKPELLLGVSADYLTAALLVVVLAALALARPPATAPVYASWRLHPALAEVALLVGSGTLAHNVRAQWLPLVWVGMALALGAATPWLAPRFRRLGIYGRLYYWLAALTASIDCVLYITPSHLLSAEWWGLTAAVGLLFGYVGLALRQGNAPFAGLSPAWQALALPGRRQLEAWLLYPAFLALALLLIQSFDHSVLTVLLMLQVVAVFSTSLLLRRQDLRYVSLAGMLGCMGRLLFFDLRQSGTVTRAVVFILMGLLLLGMNALYARFKARFANPSAPDEPDDEVEAEADDEAEEPQIVLP
ncbi:MAG: hypothetical protein ACRYFZ_24695 [Janthinobacterium lividum]